MTLFWLIAVLLIGGFLAWLVGRWSPAASRWISLAALAVDLVLTVALWARGPGTAIAPGGSPAWTAELQWQWIPAFGISFHLALDGLSLLMIALTVVLGFLSVGTSWTEITDRVGFFHFNMLWILAGVIGVFLAVDLFLFYFFWELMLIPMYFLIAIWGHERRIYAAIKFFLFTQASGLLMFLAILGLYFAHGRATGTYSFDYSELLGTPLGSTVATWLMLGFFVAFAVKLPAFPFHPWLPDAHTEAPTAGSVILAGLMLKTGAYGLLRFAVPLFPEASARFAPVAMTLGVAGILYGALLAFAQTDLKRLVAYTSVSHLGFVLVGVYAWNHLALQGVVMQMICHGLSTGGLFIVVGMLQERIHTRELGKMGGLWETVPRMGAVGLFLAMASLGLPGLGNFVAEILILLGAFSANVPVTVFATLGLVAATVYSLRIVQRAFHGPNEHRWSIPDLNLRDMAVLATTMVFLVWLGLYPRPVLEVARPALQTLQSLVMR